MAAIRKKTMGNQNYFYLEHSFKADGQVKKKELYLGKEIPKNVDKIKADFLQGIYQNKWYGSLDRVKNNFSKDFNKMPRIAKEKYFENFMVKFTYNSNRIEGSKITLKETAKLLEEGITPKNKPIRDIKETEAHKEVFYHMLNYSKDLDLNIVLFWHRMLFKDSQPHIAGQIRKHSVAVSRSKAEFPLPAELNILLMEFFKWYNQNKEKIYPVELAALVHLKFVSIHSFADGNGRISRIIMNFVLHKHNFPMLDIPYTKRDNYYTALERAQVKKIEQIFVQHIIKRYLKEHKNYLKIS